MTRINILLILMIATIGILLVSVLRSQQIEGTIPSQENLILIDVLLQSIRNDGIQLNDVFIQKGNDSIPSHLSDITSEGCLIFRMYGESCNLCIEEVIENLKYTFPDFGTNNRVVLLGSNINRRLLDNYYGKEVYSVYGEKLGLPSETYNQAVLLYVDHDNKVQSALVPDRSFPDLTMDYLRHIKSLYY